MKVEVTSPSPVKRTMAIEVDAQEMERETREVLRGFAREARIPGFRPGKAPMSLVRARFGEKVVEEVRERVMTRCFHEAARENDVRPIGNPVIDDVGQQLEGEPFRFTVSFEILPEIEIKNYRGIEARRPAVAIADVDVDAALEELRQSRSQLITEEGRAASTGDVIVCDMRGAPEGGEPFERERIFLEVGSAQNPPGFNDKLEGATAGSELAFSIDYPEEFENPDLAGKSTGYEITVHEVKIRQVPELDDEFAKDLGDFEDLAALRERIREDLLARRRHEAEKELRDKILDKVLIENPVLLPEALVEDEIRHRLEEVVRRMMRQGIDPQKVELDWKKLRDQQEEPARKSVHARMVLDAIAKAESIEVERAEVNERIERDARAMGEPPEKLRQHLKKQGTMEALKTQLVREKSLDLLTAVANIQTEE